MLHIFTSLSTFPFGRNFFRTSDDSGSGTHSITYVHVRDRL